MSLGRRLLYCTALFAILIVYGSIKHGTENIEFQIILSFYISVLFFIGFTWKKHIKNAAGRINEWCSDYRPWKFLVLVMSLIIVAPIVMFILSIPIIIISQIL